MEETERIWIEIKINQPGTEGDKKEIRDKIIEAIEKEEKWVVAVTKYDHFEGENTWTHREREG